ncbi:hypothetical protein Trydic_g2194 [Trypoxylus dichotomus]
MITVAVTVTVTEMVMVTITTTIMITIRTIGASVSVQKYGNFNRPINHVDKLRGLTPPIVAAVDQPLPIERSKLTAAEVKGFKPPKCRLSKKEESKIDVGTQ